jgi:peptidoglycan/xylan/chitin deacetylase (PgdA/CDA1 family)
LPGRSTHVWQSLQQDLRTHLQEAPRGERLRALTKRLVKYVLAALLHFAGLTGILLRRRLDSSGACLILGFHGTTDAPPGYFSRGHAIVNVRDQLTYLRRHLRHVPLEAIAGAVSRGETPPAGSFAVTFDDGLTNNVTLAMPVLRDLGLPATFFVPSALVGSARDLWVASLQETLRAWRPRVIPPESGLWPALPTVDEASRYAAYFRIKETLKDHNGRRQEILDRLAKASGGHARPPEADRVVGADLFRQMSQLPFSVGGHSRTHPILSALAPEQAREEIDGSRKDLETMLGRPVLDFAYPNGRFTDFNETTCKLVLDAGYRCAVTTEPGTVRRGDDRLALRRCLPRNVPAFLATFELLSRAWADRSRPGDLGLPLGERLSYLGSRRPKTAP